MRNGHGGEIGRKLVSAGARRPVEQGTFALTVEIFTGGDAEPSGNNGKRRH